METAYKARLRDFIVDDPGRDYVLRVRDMADDDRPREKMVKSGAGALSSRELLAVVLNTGTKREEVMAMSARILKDYGENGLASQVDPQKLAQDYRIPVTKACQIAACFELGRRFFKKSKNGAAAIRNSRQAFSYLKGMGSLPKEQFRGVYLDSHYRVIRDEIISIGSLTAGIVHPREVFKPAIDSLAAAVIVAHNHPSGSLAATASDIEITRQLSEAGRIMGIEVIDHLIIAGNRYSSILVK